LTFAIENQESSPVAILPLVPVRNKNRDAVVHSRIGWHFRDLSFSGTSDGRSFVQMPQKLKDISEMKPYIKRVGGWLGLELT
jgi:hypothetical protein